MKSPTFKVFRLIGDFVKNSAVLGASLQTRINGFVRSRNVSALAALGDEVGSRVTDPLLCRELLQVSAFVKKNVDLEQPDCRDAALAAFLQSEVRCRITNRRIEHYYLHPGRLDPELSVLVPRCQRIISQVLGDRRNFLDELPARLKITSGASATTPRRKSSPVQKLRMTIAAPARSIPYLAALRDLWGYGQKPEFVPLETNRVEFVPKNYKTYRTIAAEPSGVLPLQLAVDSWLKDRLRRIGVDLSSQVRNQELSRTGSIDGSLATLDLKSASDNLSLNLVHLLFPEDWRHLLCDLRCPSGQYVDSNGERKRLFYEKFASMGNGMTFTVETLIFFSVLRSVCGKAAEIAVYGDDLICPVDDVRLVTKLLRFFGFPLNVEKSFSSGPFRESCGKHWISGMDVTPFFIRGCPSTRGDWAHLINGLVPLVSDQKTLTFFLGVIKNLGIPFVPFNSDSRSGIFISPSEAHKRRLISSRGRLGLWQPAFRGILTYERATACSKSDRGNFLWSLKALGRSFDRFDPIAEKYRKRPGLMTESGRWLRFYPQSHTPPHLYWWDDMSRGKPLTSGAS